MPEIPSKISEEAYWTCPTVRCRQAPRPCGECEAAVHNAAIDRVRGISERCPECAELGHSTCYEAGRRAGREDERAKIHAQMRQAFAESIRGAADGLAEGVAETGWVPTVDQMVGMLREIANEIETRRLGEDQDTPEGRDGN